MMKTPRATSDNQVLEIISPDELFDSRGLKEFSLYKRALIQWDRDHNQQVLQVVDQLSPKVRRSILRILLVDNTLYILLKGSLLHIPESCAPGRIFTVEHAQELIVEEVRILHRSIALKKGETMLAADMLKSHTVSANQ